MTKNGRAGPATTLNLDSDQSRIILDQHDEELKLPARTDAHRPKKHMADAEKGEFE